MTIAVTYYTHSYRDAFERLHASCRAFHVELIARETPDLGSWNANCRIKPAFLMAMWLELREPCWWLDADAELRAELPRDMPECDLGVHFHHTDEKPSPGTLYLPAGNTTWRILADWNEETARCGTHDKDSLPATLARFPHARVWDMPEPLCAIKSLYKMGLEHDTPPIVWHHQASREMRKISHFPLA